MPTAHTDPTLKVPGHVGVALSTGRPEILNALIAQLSVTNAPRMTNEEVVGILTVLRNTMTEINDLKPPEDPVEHARSVIRALGLITTFDALITHLRELGLETVNGLKHAERRYAQAEAVELARKIGSLR